MGLKNEVGAAYRYGRRSSPPQHCGHDQHHDQASMSEDVCMTISISGRGFLGLPQKGISIKTSHLGVLSEPSAIHHRRVSKKR